MVKKIKGNYGTCFICDNMDPKYGLTTWPEGTFQFTLTDPPYNINAKQPGGMHKNTKKELRPEVRIYNDKMKKEAYYEWCNVWFKEVKRISESGAFFTGFTNLGYWLWNHNLEYWIWYRKNSGIRAFNSFFNAQEPIVIFGNQPRKIIRDVFDVYVNNGFLNKSREKWIHPHPKPIKLIKMILEQANITVSVLDCFAGSGTVIQVCEEMGINWIAYEKDPKYIPDIEKRIKKGKIYHGNYIKSKPTDLGGYING
jgi:DNA modification methylase